VQTVNEYIQLPFFFSVGAKHHLDLSSPHNCNKTKIKDLYKTCRTLAADQVLPDIMQIAKSL